jgi:hypothetical protein
MDKNKIFIKKAKNLIPLVITLSVLYKYEGELRELLNYQSGNNNHRIMLFIVLPTIMFVILKYITDKLINSFIKN